MAEADRRVGQEGSRWYNEPPTGKQIAEWFEANVKLHDGLEHKDYVPGITMIPSTEKVKQVIGWGSDGQPVIAKRENLVYTPYAKVETRVKYFHDLMATKEKEWIGIIEPVTPAGADDRLPPGFFTYLIPTGENKGVRYICCTMKVTVYEREDFDEVREVVDTRNGVYRTRRIGKKIIDAPPATKMIPLTSTWNDNVRADDMAMMKAETGAVGRALGLAGMLVIPGTGVATAEDMGEAEALQSQPSGAAPTIEPPADLPAEQLPVGQDELLALREEAVEAINSLKNEYPDAFKLFQEWAQSRGIGRIDAIVDPTILRGLTSKAIRDKEAEDAKQEEPPASPGR